MINGSVLIFTPLVLISGSALVSLILANRARKLANMISASTLTLSLGLLLYAFLKCLLYGAHFKAYYYVINAATGLMSVLLILLGLLATVYSFGYMEHELRYDLYSPLLLSFIVSMVYIVLATDMSLIYLTFELGTATGGVLITFSRRRSSLRAATRFLALNILAALLILTGMIIQYYHVRSLKVIAINMLPENVRLLTLLFYTLGFSIKAGLVPFGLLWLPPAHSEAPIPIHTLLSAALVQSATFVLLRIYSTLIKVNMLLIGILITLGVLSLLIGVFEALIEAIWGSKYSKFHVSLVNICGIKRVWAFSTISEVGYIMIFLALYLSEPSHENAIVFLGGALVHMINHGLAKAQLLFDTGIAIKISHAEDMNYMGGVSKIYPLGNVTFLISCLSLGLVPGFAGYGTLRELCLNPDVPIYVRIAVAITATTTIASILISWYRTFLTKPKSKLADLSDISKAMLVPGPLLALLLMVIGVLCNYGLIDKSKFLERLIYDVTEGIKVCK